MTTIDQIKKGMTRVRSHSDGISRQRVANNVLVSYASNNMRDKLNEKAEQGRFGWWEDECTEDELKILLQDHFIKDLEGDKGCQMVDIMNFAAMILAKRQHEKEKADGKL